MNILVFNCGSSSLNYKVFAETGSGSLEVICAGKAHRVGVRGSEPSFIEHHFQEINDKQILPIQNHREAARLALQFLQAHNLRVDAIGHRFVHGGTAFQKSALLTGPALKALEACMPLAPIHNPNSMSVIEECRQALPDLPQYAVFDTAFHAGMPEYASTYALPEALRRQGGFRKYGFHGLSYQFVTRQAAQFLGRPLESLRLVACHLGTGGSSVVAVENGQSVDTSMGYSPLAGLMMSTRTGDLDPQLPLALMEREHLSPKQISDLFNKKSGLLGISGFSSDLRDLIRAMDERGDERAALAFSMYTGRLKKTIGAFAAVLGGLDALIFTDDIGVQNSRVREAACAGLEWCGVQLDRAVNAAAPKDRIVELSAPSGQVHVLSVPTDEERVIGMEGCKLLAEVRHAAH